MKEKSSLDILEQFKKLNLSQNFCLVPFTTLILEPDGKVGVCRQKGSDFIVGDLNKSSIEEIWNSEFLKKWRSEFLTGKVNICKDEIKHKKCNLCPDNNELLDDIDFSVFQKKTVLKIGANFSGECNLQCIMCNIYKLPRVFYENKERWSNLEKNIFPYIKEIDLFSGEPFIQDITYKLIDRLSVLNSDCLWTFTTNGNWDLNEQIKEKLDMIKIKNIIVSIDATNETTYKKIRKNGDFNQTIKTINNLVKYCESKNKKKNIHLNFLMQKSNWEETIHFIRFAIDRRVHPFITFLYEPEAFSLLSLSNNERHKILDYFFNMLDKSEIKYVMRVLSPLVDSLDAEEKKHYLKKIIFL